MRFKTHRPEAAVQDTTVRPPDSCANNPEFRESRGCAKRSIPQKQKRPLPLVSACVCPNGGDRRLTSVASRRRVALVDLERKPGPLMRQLVERNPPRLLPFFSPCKRGLGVSSSRRECSIWPEAGAGRMSRQIEIRSSGSETNVTEKGTGWVLSVI